ncbi:MAG TPA: LLM class flavin-dependent oxidoreductase [Acidimicrobiales bacterium]
MKVRIGVGMGALGGDPAELCDLVDDLDDLGFDSIWLPEVLTAPTLDPLAALAFAAAHNPRLKLGTTMLLPGRNVVRVAKQLATLDRLSAGRLLITFVPGLAQPPESGAVGVPPKEKGPRMDEAFPLVRRLWAGETVGHRGPVGEFESVTLSPLPAQEPLEFWTGGMLPSALVRCGRYADGWLPSSCTPDEVAAGRAVIDEAASEAGREISREHFGVSVAYAPGPLDDRLVAALGRARKGVDPTTVVPAGLDGLRSFLEAFLEVGFSKFVVRPLARPDAWRTELEALADAVGDLQT